MIPRLQEGGCTEHATARPAGTARSQTLGPGAFAPVGQGERREGRHTFPETRHASRPPLCRLHVLPITKHRGEGGGGGRRDRVTRLSALSFPLAGTFLGCIVAWHASQTRHPHPSTGNGHGRENQLAAPTPPNRTPGRSGGDGRPRRGAGLRAGAAARRRGAARWPRLRAAARRPEGAGVLRHLPLDPLAAARVETWHGRVR